MRKLLDTQAVKNAFIFVKWVLIALLVGGIVGLAGTAFGYAVHLCTQIWNRHAWTLYLMPLAGVMIVWLYAMARQQKCQGTDAVLDAAADKGGVPGVLAPLIAGSTVLSHLTSASVGREGAALQLGGSLAAVVGRLLQLSPGDKRVCVMCGMGAGFAALFGTPLTACLFAMEVFSVGTVQLYALLPCALSSLLASSISAGLGLAAERFPVSHAAFNAGMALPLAVVAVACALVGMLMCLTLHKSTALFKRFAPNPYVRALMGSALFIAITLLSHSRDYNGAGMALIGRCFAGEAVMPWAFLVKLLFTAVALGAGFKGGEIVPALCVGATLGYALALPLGLSPQLATAVGMACLFVSVTNCPLASLLMACELFGFEGAPCYALAIAVSFALSGHAGLYHSQRFACENLPDMPWAMPADDFRVVAKTRRFPLAFRFRIPYNR